MPIKKIIHLILGSICLGLGALGSLLPIVPTVPFLLLAGYCFARSSHKLNRWFCSTKLYQENLADYVAGRGMTGKVKLRIMITVTALMSLGFILMDAVPVGRIVLACVWLIHIVYFLFGIKTIPTAKESVSP